LHSAQKELDSLDDKFADETLKLEAKYNKLKQPFLKKRSQVIKEYLKTDPDFWVKVFQHHDTFRHLLVEVDLEILRALEELEVVDNEDIKSGYVITFKFGSNPHFSNTQLSKEFKIDVTTGDLKVEGTPVNWNDAKFGEKHSDSFFYLWSRFELPPPADVYDPDSHMTEFAESIRNELYKNPIDFYLNPRADDGLDDDDAIEIGESAFGDADEEGGEGEEGGEE